MALPGLSILITLRVTDKAEMLALVSVSLRCFISSMLLRNLDFNSSLVRAATELPPHLKAMRIARVVSIPMWCVSISSSNGLLSDDDASARLFTLCQALDWSATFCCSSTKDCSSLVTDSGIEVTLV